VKGSRIKEYVLKYNTPRRVVQFLSFVFFSAIVFNLGVLPFLLPVLWTWGLRTNTVGDAFTAIQLMLYNGVFPWLAFASFLLVGILIGKSLCGWVCPFGFIQDLIDFIKRKKSDFSLRTHDSGVYLKYAVLGIPLFISATFSISRVTGGSSNYESALGVFVKAPFTSLSPAETLFATLPQMVLNLARAIGGNQKIDVGASITNTPYIFWAQVVILIIVLIFVAFVPRAWCRYLCPHGAFMAILNNFSLIGLRRDPVKCAKGGCRLCVTVCPMRVPILDLPWEKFSHPECIYCMKCVDACKDHAIGLKYP
jgi:ferredoxin-type protein NapH